MSDRRVLRIIIGMAAVLLLVLPYSGQAYDYSYARIVRLSLVQGDVQINRPSQSGWETAIANMPIQQGFSVATNDGRAEIEFESGATARIAEKTVLQFTELALSNGGRITKLKVTQGTANFYANIKSDDSFIVATPQLQVAIPQKAEFRVDVFNDGTSVSVFKGDASVVTPAGTKDVTKGHTLAYSASAPDQVRIEANPAEDDWDRWVDNRENTITTATNQTLQYTSAPFDYGMADLSSYGGWNYFPGYGYGWQPWSLGRGWAPFMNGYWGFYPGLGWTWISYESWGWVPYHFGSWAFSPVYGWLWLPGYYNFWCPAPVQWVVVGNQIGWTPLRPTSPAPSGSGVQTPRPVPPIIVGGRVLGRGGHNQVLPGDTPDGKVQVLPAPPLPSGKMPHPTVAGAGSAVAVPTAPGLARLGSGVTFDPAEQRFVTSNSGSVTLPPARVLGNAGVSVGSVPTIPAPRLPASGGPIMPPRRVPMSPPPHTVAPPPPHPSVTPPHTPQREFHEPPPPPPPHTPPHAFSVEPRPSSPPARHASGAASHRSA